MSGVRLMALSAGLKPNHSSSWSEHQQTYIFIIRGYTCIKPLLSHWYVINIRVYHVMLSRILSGVCMITEQNCWPANPAPVTV